MAEKLDGYRYIGYAASRWRWIAVSCATALAAAVLLTGSQKPQYTATARILIDPPSGSDARTTTAVSPIYLESLKTYESFAAGDSLFLAAMDQFGLRQDFGKSPLESVKKRVLRAGLVKNTRILEIAVTLPEPRKAQAVAQFLAESTAGTNQKLASGNDHDLTQGLAAEQQAARQRMDEADAKWAKILGSEPTDELAAALTADSELRGKLEEQLLGAQVDMASAQQREKDAQPGDSAQIHGIISDARARGDALQKQIEALDKKTAGNERVLGLRQADRDQAEGERKAAGVQMAALDARLMQARAEAGSRAERLRVIDVGIVPERPSSPSWPLNLAVALFLGLLLPLLYLALELSGTIGVREAARRRRTLEAPRSSQLGR